MRRLATGLVGAAIPVAVALRPASAQEAPRETPAVRRHSLTAYAPDLTFLNTPDRFGLGGARVSSASLSYRYALVEDVVYVGVFGGPATTHPQLRDVAGRWSGGELGVTAAAGGLLGRFLWLGAQLRASGVRSPFRIDGYVPAADGRSFVPVRGVRAALRQNNLEGAALARWLLGNSGVYLSTEAAFALYARGVFSDADLYPGFTADPGLFFDRVTRLPQDEYHGGVALRVRAGLGIRF